MARKRKKTIQKDAQCSHTPPAICSADVSALILSCLPHRDLARCRAVCRAWNTIAAGLPPRREPGWLVLNKYRSRDSHDKLAAYSAACRQWFSLGSVSNNLATKHPARWTRPSLAASAHGLVCCAYDKTVSTAPALAVFNPVTPAVPRGTQRQILLLEGSRMGEFGALAMWKWRGGGYGVLAAGPASIWGDRWEIALFDSRTRALRRSIASVFDMTRQRLENASLLCCSARDDGSSLLFVWGASAAPQALAEFVLRGEYWQLVHDFFPSAIAWEPVTIRAARDRLITARVEPNLFVIRGTPLLVALRDSIHGALGLEIWELERESGRRRWVARRSMPEEMGRQICEGIDAGSGADSWLRIRAVAISSGDGENDLVYVVLDWGWEIRVLAHDLCRAVWCWMPGSTPAYDGSHVGSCIFSLDPCIGRSPLTLT